jgi:hypothetical protein
VNACQSRPADVQWTRVHQILLTNRIRAGLTAVWRDCTMRLRERTRDEALFIEKAREIRSWAGTGMRLEIFNHFLIHA